MSSRRIIVTLANGITLANPQVVELLPASLCQRASPLPNRSSDVNARKHGIFRFIVIHNSPIVIALRLFSYMLNFIWECCIDHTLIY